MTDELNQTLHPDDGDLVRLLDGALALDERPRVESHVRECLDCRARRSRIERRAARLSVMLRAADIPAPTTALRIAVRRPAATAVRRWRMAAVVVLALGGAMMVTPVRAWVVSTARAVWARATGGVSSATEESFPSSAVSFVPGGPVLTIRVPAAEAGAVTIQRTAGERASAFGAGNGSVLVLPDEFRFAGNTDPVPDYQVRIPETIGMVRVWVGERLVTFRPTVQNREMVVQLSR